MAYIENYLTSINMADGKFGGKRRRELKEEKKYIYTKIMLIIIINITSIEGDVSVFA
jgi:hypothetical protein